MDRIRVNRTIHIKQPSIDEEAMVSSIGYASATENILMETVYFGVQRGWYFKRRGIVDSGYVLPAPIIRRSDDNGRTWREVEKWRVYGPIHGRWRMLFHAPDVVPDPRSNSVLRIYLTYQEIEGLLPWVAGSPSNLTRLAWTQISDDRGRSWSQPEQLVVRGESFNAVNWAPDVRYGSGMGLVEGARSVWLDDRRFLLPFSVATAPNRHDFRSGGLIGCWREDGSGVDWDVTSYVGVRSEFSNQGGGEPSIAVLPDGRWLMSLRTRVMPGDSTILPSGKFHTVSTDMGVTWSEPEPFRYDDGSQAFFPASLGTLVLSTKNGRLYLIANYLDEPTARQCDPRTTVQIAEVDRGSLKIHRDTLTVIETRDVAGGVPENVRFSNWRLYQDRETGNIVMFMTACPGNCGRDASCGIPSDSYRYEITLPD